jgi:hypothetical protein
VTSRGQLGKIVDDCEGLFQMQELVAAIPYVETLLELEPEELGAKLLFIIRDRKLGRVLINASAHYGGVRITPKSGRATSPLKESAKVP